MSVLRFSLAALAAPRIEMPAALRERARVPIDRMLALS
jgi:quinolinate synthase